MPWFALFGVITFAACAGPVQATWVDPKVVHGDLAQSAVTTGDLSLPTRNVLFELVSSTGLLSAPKPALLIDTKPWSRPRATGPAPRPDRAVVPARGIRQERD